MRVIVLYIFLILFSCRTSRDISKTKQVGTSYLIKEVRSVNSWDIIYATRQDSIYKIVVNKEYQTFKNCKKIIVGKSYNFILSSMRENLPEINGIKMSPINYLDVHCYSYDKDTDICIEPNKGVYDLYHLINTESLCYKINR